MFQIEEIMEEVFLRLLEESKYAGSHPEESYQYGCLSLMKKNLTKMVKQLGVKIENGQSNIINQWEC